ncbi:uncharacterized protein LOC111074269 isoform X2 [Drosophila obscura]|uniref:uncharacterized protein LOC111074269 isoform X2 n=1 Tax=Drosophila obscura TaxID=7282 RepID=UPI001BB11C89|nr:uncharacterized protein LOC111074269 isoform X2 [Drosophila obscura]
MVSRRKILSRSRDDLNLDQTFTQQEEEEDVWYQKDKLYKEHIQEVLDKWTQIDDEIWAKVIVFERNRRVAKAYARAPVLTINGSDDGFDGMRIGLCGFDNPMRDQKTDEMKRVIGQGVKIKMDDAGNILVRRYAKSNVYVKSTASSPNEETSIGAEILKLPNQALESEKIVKLFDMKKFQSNVNRELRRAYPDRRRLETQCLSAVAFVKSESDVLECPIWVLIVNVVAMDMLKSKLPPVQRPIVDIKNRPRIPIPDEDPYSVAGNGSGGSSGSSGFGSGHQQQAHAQQLGKHLNNGNNGHVAATREQLLLQTQQLAHKRSEKPPKLPPRDNVYAHDLIPKPDYDDIDLETRIKLSRGKSDKGKDNKKYDDPYYCGLRARVPNFVKSGKKGSGQGLKDQRDGNGNNINIINNNNNSNGGMSTLSQKKTSMIHNHLAGMHPHHIQQQQQLMAAAAAAHAVHHHPGHQQQQQQQNHHHQIWQTRSYESGIGIYKQGVASTPHHKTHAMQMQLQLQQHQQQQQQPQSLPTDLTTATTAKTQSTPHKARSQQQQQHHHHHQHNLPPQTRTPHSYPHAHPHHKHHHNHSHMHQCERHARHLPPSQPTLPPFYDNLEESVGRRLSTRRPVAESAAGAPCNCVSCYALAPLCGSVPPPRPQRSLSQQQLRRHQQLSGSLVEKQTGVVKWCSESDISVLEHVQEEDPADERYDDCYEYDDFDMDFDIDDDLTARMGYSRGTETVDMYVDRAQLRQIQAPAVLASSRNKSQSTESFFEQPNEEGSLYMYGGRKRIVAKAPSAANIYDRVRGSMDPDRGYANGRFNLAARTQQYHNRSSHKAPVLPSPSWRGGKRQQQEAKHFQNSDKRRYDNATNNSSNNNSHNNICSSSSSSNKNKRQLTNSNKNNDDILKSKNNFNSKTKSIATSASAQAQAAKATTTTASSGGAVAAASASATMTTNASGGAVVAAVATAASKKASPIHDPPTIVNNAQAAANGLHGLPPPPAARTGRSASRLDISDMESIYGYLKPRKPRSLSLKKIQILDY